MKRPTATSSHLAMKSISKEENISTGLIKDIKSILDAARSQAASAINMAMLNAYWKIGERIVLEEHGGKFRAEYGTASLNELSKQLTLELGKGFSPRNLRNYRQFFILFPDWIIWNARVPNLTWTHIRAILRVTDKNAREWYLTEASSQMWSSRTLDRNVSTQYYYRLLASSNSEEVKKEMEIKTSGKEYGNLSPAVFLKSPLAEYDWDIHRSLDELYSSTTFAKLNDPDCGLYYQGAVYIFQFLKSEIETGKVA